jgi:hypothetical protein
VNTALVLPFFKNIISFLQRVRLNISPSRGKQQLGNARAVDGLHVTTFESRGVLIVFNIEQVNALEKRFFIVIIIIIIIIIITTTTNCI